MSKPAFKRLIELPDTDSILLFGPRGAGKSTLLKRLFDEGRCLWVDLLLAKEEERYSHNPDALIAEVKAMPATHTHVVIDEIQKVPKLLDAVHYLIESTEKVFVLTGSSARKLIGGASNLLAGRAFVYNLAPLTFQELNEVFKLQDALTWGMLPKIYQYDTERQRSDYLKAYARTYLKEEVWAEQFIRNLNPFRYFLEVAAQCNGKILNFSKIGRDVGVEHTTVENYYTILEDTLLGFFLPAYDGSFRKQINKAAKFYLFDVGVERALAKMLSVPVRERTNYYGDLFEHFIITEIKKYCLYFTDEFSLSYLRTKTNQEIDLIVKRPGQKVLLIEIKSTDNVQAEELKSIMRLKEEFPECEAICLSRDPKKKVYGDMVVWPWQDGILHYFSP